MPPTGHRSFVRLERAAPNKVPIERPAEPLPRNVGNLAVVPVADSGKEWLFQK